MQLELTTQQQEAKAPRHDTARVSAMGRQLGSVWSLFGGALRGAGSANDAPQEHSVVNAQATNISEAPRERQSVALPVRCADEADHASAPAVAAVTTRKGA